MREDRFEINDVSDALIVLGYRRGMVIDVNTKDCDPEIDVPIKLYELNGIIDLLKKLKGSR